MASGLNGGILLMIFFSFKKTTTFHSMYIKASVQSLKSHGTLQYEKKCTKLV